MERTSDWSGAFAVNNVFVVSPFKGIKLNWGIYVFYLSFKLFSKSPFNKLKSWNDWEFVLIDRDFWSKLGFESLILGFGAVGSYWETAISIRSSKA